MTSVEYTTDSTGRREWARDGRMFTYARSLRPGDRTPGGFTVTSVAEDGADVVIGWRDGSGATGETIRDRFTEQELS